MPGRGQSTLPSKASATRGRPRLPAIGFHRVGSVLRWAATKLEKLVGGAISPESRVLSAEGTQDSALSTFKGRQE